MSRFCFLIPLAAAFAAAQVTPPSRADISYGPHERNVLDLWKAPQAAPAPLVVFIHGGGFTAGDKAGVRQQPAFPLLLKEGFAVASINYRYRRHAPIQDILRDAARAIQFLRLHAAEYGIDKKRVGVFGGSAGAGTSLWLAFHDDLAEPGNPDPVLRESSRVRAAGAIQTQFSYDLLRWRELFGEGIEKLFEAEAGGGAKFYGLASEEEVRAEAGRRIRADVDMEGLITKDDPPVFLLTRLGDGRPESRGHLNHHPRHAMAIEKRMSELGLECEMYLPAMGRPPKPGEGEALTRFFVKHLR